MTTRASGEKCRRNRWGKQHLQPSGAPERESGLPPRTAGNTADQNRLKPCGRMPFDLWKELELESQKGNPGLREFRDHDAAAVAEISTECADQERF
jgi:hypothetical protein